METGNKVGQIQVFAKNIKGKANEEILEESKKTKNAAVGKFLNIYLMVNSIKKSFIISLVSVIIGAIQMTFFLPNGLSCIDGTSSLFDGVLFYMPIQFIVVFVLTLNNIKNTKYFILIFILLFWIFINKIEFENRYACWSTFSQIEIIKVVLLKSSYTCFVCMGIFYLLFRKHFQK